MYEIKTIADVKRVNKEKGYHFFDKETMKFWGCKIESPLYKNMCFVTSELDFSGERRYYNVRQFNPETCHINTIGQFNLYTKKEQAIAVAKIVDTPEYLKSVMKDGLETRGYMVSEEKLNELYDIYEDCQIWIDGKMISGWSYDEVEDFVKHSSCVDEVFENVLVR